MRRYSMTDAAFTDRWRASSSLAVAVAVDLGPRSGRGRSRSAAGEAPNAAADELTPEEVAGIVGETLGRAFDKAEDWLRSEAAAVLAAFKSSERLPPKINEPREPGGKLGR